MESRDEVCRLLPSCANEISAYHLTIDGSKGFVSVPLNLVIKWRTIPYRKSCNVSVNLKRIISQFKHTQNQHQRTVDFIIQLIHPSVT